MMQSLRRSLRLAIALLSLVALSVPVRAQTCSTLTPDVTFVSVTSGGTQTLQVSVPPDPFIPPYHFVGALSLGSPFASHYLPAGIQLPPDRYMLATYTGQSPFLPNGVPGTTDGHTFQPDSTGSAVVQVQVPPQIYAHLIGRTLHHAIYSYDPNVLLTSCGSNVVPLMLVP